MKLLKLFKEILFSKKFDQSFVRLIVKRYLLIAFSIVVVIGLYSFYTGYRLFTKENEKIYEHFLQSEQNILDNEVKKAIDFIEFYRNNIKDISIKSPLKTKSNEILSITNDLFSEYNNSKSHSEIKELCYHSLKSIKTSNPNINIQIINSSGKYILNHRDKEYEGKYLKNLYGKPGQIALNKIKDSDEEFVQIEIPKKNYPSNRLYNKLIHIRKFKPFGWYIIVGIFDIDAEMDFKNKILERLSEIKFGDDNYIFIFDKNNNLLVNNNRLQEKSDVSNRLSTVMDSIANNHILNQSNLKLNLNKSTNDFAVVCSYPEWGWYIGAFSDLSTFKTFIESEKSTLSNYYISILYEFILITAIILFAIIVFMYATYRKVIAEFLILNKFFRDTTNLNKEIETSQLKLKEFQDLASSVNHMLNKKNSAEQEKEKYIQQLKLQQNLLEEKTTELSIVNSKLKKSESDLKKTNLQKDRFFSIIAHDLKNPFNAVLGYSDIILEDYDDLSDEDLKTYLKNIKATSKQAFRLLEELLTWARIQSSRIDFNPVKFNLYEAALNAKELMSSNAATKGISIELLLPKKLDVIADENMINTIFRNLVSNSIKFSNQNGKVYINAVKNKNFVEAIIEDEGIGISKDQLSDLFAIDKNKSTPGTNNEKGTGIGLILCKEMVEKNGGKIHVVSQVGKGTRIHFTIPKNSN